MIVTINTDASFSKVHKVGAYAFWIVSDTGKIKRSGMLKGSMKHPARAELKTIVNALYCLQLQSWQGITKVIINTDSLNSIHLLTNDKQAIKKYNIPARSYQLETRKFEAIVKKLKLNIEMRHVRSHKDTDSARTWVNDWCDKEAKKELGKYLKSISK